MKSRQRGVTMIGWICLLIPLALTLYAGIRVGPEYFNYYKVVTAMKETASELKSDETLSPTAVQIALAKRFDIGYIYTPSVKDIVVDRGDKGWQMTADYESTVPMFGNLYLLMSFKSTVPIN
jgi:Domain of unknown function (DUF4845)